MALALVRFVAAEVAVVVVAGDMVAGRMAEAAEVAVGMVRKVS